MQQEGSIHQILKDETRGVHAQTEKSSFMRFFFQPNLSQSDYLSLISQLQSALAPIEAVVQSSPHLAHFPSVADRQYYKALCLELEEASIPLESSKPDFALVPSKAFLGGMLYALEGSANGGKIIFERLRWAPSKGYFSTQSAFALVRWPHFLNDLKTQLGSADAAQARAGAVYVFSRFAGEG